MFQNPIGIKWDINKKFVLSSAFLFYTWLFCFSSKRSMKTNRTALSPIILFFSLYFLLVVMLCYCCRQNFLRFDSSLQWMGCCCSTIDFISSSNFLVSHNQIIFVSFPSTSRNNCIEIKQNPIFFNNFSFFTVLYRTIFLLKYSSKYAWCWSLVLFGWMARGLSYTHIPNSHAADWFFG